MNPVVGKVVRPCASAVRRLAARAYVAGPRVEDALAMCRRLRDQGIAGSIGFWNVAGTPPRSVADEYLVAIERLAVERFDCNVSIKLRPLGYECALVREITQHADDRDVAVHVDSMTHEAAGITQALVADAIRHHCRVGVTLPGRWRRSLDDAERAIELGARVRVVKGQWLDPTVPDLSPRLGFLAVIDQLAGRARHVAVATHDADLATEALRRLRRQDTSCEIELLFGLPIRPLVNIARRFDVPVRVHTPYGDPSLPYRLSEIVSDRRILARGVRDAVLGRSFKLALA
jgi:proline dehydrogenase